MPLDLSPCDVGVPSCQPTFDLTKKQFMPRRNGKRVRDTVKAGEESKTDEVFTKKLEISMVKWRPVLVCRRNTAAPDDMTNEDISIFQSIEHWWNCRKRDVPDSESDELSYFYDQGETTEARLASTTVFDIAAPFACPQTVATAADRELIAINEQKVYQQYYSHPMAPEYVSLSHSPNLEDKVSPFHLQQNRRYQPSSTKFLDWTNPCMACKIASRH